jgi:hypothetical protein
MPFVDRVRWSVCGKDAESVDSSAIDATEAPSAGRAACAGRHNRYFARAS